MISCMKLLHWCHSTLTCRSSNRNTSIFLCMGIMFYIFHHLCIMWKWFQSLGITSCYGLCGNLTRRSFQIYHISRRFCQSLGKSLKFFLSLGILCTSIQFCCTSTLCFQSLGKLYILCLSCHRSSMSYQFLGIQTLSCQSLGRSSMCFLFLGIPTYICLFCDISTYFCQFLGIQTYVYHFYHKPILSFQ